MDHGKRPKRDPIAPTGAVDVARVDGALLGLLSARWTGRAAVRRFVIALTPGSALAGLDLRLPTAYLGGGAAYRCSV